MQCPWWLLTWGQGRTGADAGTLPDEGVEVRRQAGQSSGVRGLSRRGSAVRLAAPFVEADRSLQRLWAALPYRRRTQGRGWHQRNYAFSWPGRGCGHPAHRYAVRLQYLVVLLALPEPGHRYRQERRPGPCRLATREVRRRSPARRHWRQ